MDADKKLQHVRNSLHSKAAVGERSACAPESTASG